MKKILILSFLALLTSCSSKNQVSTEQNTCQEFEDASSLNSKFKTRGIWNGDNFTSKEFEICNTSLRSKKAIKISYYNPTEQTRYVNSPSFNKKQLLSPGIGELYLCPIKKDQDKKEKIYSASISPIYLPSNSKDVRELGIKLVSITEFRYKC